MGMYTNTMPLIQQANWQNANILVFKVDLNYGLCIFDILESTKILTENISE